MLTSRRAPLSIVVLARPGLSWWLGDEFASHSYFALQLLACGVLFNALAYLPTFMEDVARVRLRASGRHFRTSWCTERFRKRLLSVIAISQPDLTVVFCLGSVNAALGSFRNPTATGLGAFGGQICCVEKIRTHSKSVMRSVNVTDRLHRVRRNSRGIVPDYLADQFSSGSVSWTVENHWLL